MFLASELLGSLRNMTALQLLSTCLILLISFVGLAFKMLEILNFREWLCDPHGIFAVQEEELLFVVRVNGLDFLHQGGK